MHDGRNAPKLPTFGRNHAVQMGSANPTSASTGRKPWSRTTPLRSTRKAERRFRPPTCFASLADYPLAGAQECPLTWNGMTGCMPAPARSVTEKPSGLPGVEETLVSREAAAPHRGSIVEDDRHRIGVDVAIPTPRKTSVQALEFEAERAIKANGERIVGNDRELNLVQIGAKLRGCE